jgi:hypothetical protein
MATSKVEHDQVEQPPARGGAGRALPPLSAIWFGARAWWNDRENDCETASGSVMIPGWNWWRRV